ncbi:hypothetical protein F4801DRAFT_569646 [Xylaria longipes]|nr:hypothetical protein F4801DRAFT_569646 [Xylaria longipes]
MYNNNHYSSSSSGPPHQPPAPGYEAYPPPPPPSSLPPPPPPPPPAPQQRDTRDRSNGRDGRDDRDRHDSYYPRDRSDDRRFRGPYSDLRQPRGSHRDYRDDPRDSRDYRDSRERRDDYDYRPPRGEFTFRQDAPGSIASYRPSQNPKYASHRNPDHRPHHLTLDARSYDRRGADNYAPRRDDSRRTRGGQRHDRPRRPGPYQRREKEKAADRLLLSKRFDDQPELMLGDRAVRATYRDVDELSDSDEVDMDISDNGDSDSNRADRPAKRARTDTSAAASAQDVPKWSNPDPYTALPPPENTRKKDVVQLIRKARVEAEAQKPTVSTEAADFISCDFSDDDNKVTGHVSDRVAETLPRDAANDAANRPNASMGLPAASLTLPPKPPISSADRPPQQIGKPQPTQSQSALHIKRGSKTSAPVDLTPSASLGNRKRTIDDEILLPVQPPHAPLKKVNRMAPGGSVVSAWQPVPGKNPCPWAAENDHSGVPNGGTRLHMEIKDFYEYVSPRDYEEKLRQELVSRLKTLVGKKWRDARIFPFGSFMSGLYLPTADMDIAICSKNYIDGKYASYDKKKFLWQMKSYLEMRKVAYRDSVEAITRAKVPLLKYTDDHTGLKVDISFERLDGHNAIATFRKWKEQYPAMPPLVAVIKHFLLMRALNEPVNGGLGGFSVICMVVHLLQMSPQVQSRSITDNHLGQLLMEFLYYYGTQFKYEKVAIRMDPPGTLNKAKASTIVYRNLDRLSIIDPNNPENDISGGSSSYHVIKHCFAEAYDALRTAMKQSASEPPSTSSDRAKKTLLYPLFAGNYSQFELQRQWLQKLDSEGASGYIQETPNNTDPLPTW